MKELPFKGYIMPNGFIIYPDKTLSHESMAFSYIRDFNLLDEYRNSRHSAAQDFLIYRLNAMQVRASGKKVLVLLSRNYLYFSKYIDTYQKFDPGWEIELLPEQP